MKKIYLFRVPHPKGKTDFVMVPIGLLYISSIIKEKKLANIKFKDMALYFKHNADNILKEDINKFKPDIVGISAFSRDFELVCEYCNIIKKILPNSIIIIGGPISATSVNKMLEYADFIVNGEGEKTICEFLKLINSGNNDFSKVPNLIYKENGKIIRNKISFIEDIDKIPAPDWSLINFEDYFSNHSFIRFRKKREYSPLFTSRGCPFKCAYCHKLFGKFFRPHSPERVVNDIKTLYNKGVREFQIIDDSFNLNKKRVIKIFELLDKENIKDIYFAFPNGIEATKLDKNILKILKDHGTYYISFAIESASQRIRDLINKKQNLKKVLHSLKTASNLGIFCHGFFMVGFPDEYPAEIKKTLNLMLNPYLHSAEVFNVMIYPETELASKVKKLPDYTTYFDYFSDSINFSDHISVKEINKLKQKAFIRFYIDPIRILRLLKELQTYENKILVFIKLFFLFILKMAGKLYGWKDHN